MKPLSTLLVCGCAAVALIGCGSSADKESSASPASTKAPTSAQDQAATQVCGARDGIQTQVQTLTSLSAGSSTKADVTSALSTIKTDLQKMKDAQPDLALERKQQVVRQTVAGLSKSDAQTQAKQAAASLESAVKESLQPIRC